MTTRTFRLCACLAAAALTAVMLPYACGDSSDAGADGGAAPDAGGAADSGPPEDGGAASDSGGEEDSGVGDAGVVEDGGVDSGAATGEGIGCFLMISVIEMMGQKVGLAVAGFYPETNLVPFDPTKGVKGFAPDTCRTPETAVAECQSAADCVEGQICAPETDQNGKPIAGTGNCENPTGDPVDIGPVTVEGFADGAKTLMYNPGQSGAYTVDGQGDGQVDPASIAPDADYTFSGSGDAAQGLGAFSGTLHVPPFIALIEPVPQPNRMGMSEVSIDTKADLTFKWEGSSNGYVRITISSKDSSVECLARDDGEFVIPASAMTGLTLSTFSLLNSVNIERTTYGTAAGPGLVNPQISSMMTILVSAKPL